MKLMLLILSSLIVSGHADVIKASDKTDAYFANLKSFMKSDKVSVAEFSIKDGQSPDSERKEKLCIRDEMDIANVEAQLFGDLKTGLTKSGKSSAFRSFVKTIRFPAMMGESPRSISGISVFTPSVDGAKMTYASFRKMFSQIDYVDFSTVDYSINFKDRSAEQSRPTAAQLKVRFDWRGLDKAKAKRQDRGVIVMDVARTGETWKIKNARLESYESLAANRAPAFAESQTASMNVPVELRTEAIRRGGYAMSTADVNSDGIPDLLVAVRSKMVLYLGKKGGRFEEAKNSGLEKYDFVKTAIFADFTNRGVQDVLITRMDHDNRSKQKGENLDVVLLRGNGKGKFEPSFAKFREDSKYNLLDPMPAAVADFNGDGKLDFYVGYPGTRDFTDSRKGRSADYKPQGVYFAKKGYEFKDYTEVIKTSDLNQGSKLFPHASIAVNFDQKSGVDLLVADDRGNLSPAYVNKEGLLMENAEEIGLGNWSYGMSIAAGDYNNDGVTDLLMTSVNMDSARRLNKACDRNFMSGQFVQGSDEGLRVFEGLGNGKFQEVTRKAGVGEIAGQGAAGVTFIDYDHDGFQDIYLVNGLWSGTPDGQDLSALFVANLRANDANLVHALKGTSNVSFKEFLSEAHGEVSSFTDVKWKEQKGQRPSMAGYQKNRLFHNNGDGTYTEVGYFEGVDSISDGYVVSHSDINGDGAEDLVLRNADPGTSEHTFAPVQIFLNQSPSPVERMVELRFEGKESTRDPFGLFAIATIGKNRQVQNLVSNSGAVQDEFVLRYYLPKGEKITSLEVHWPKGNVQTFNQLAPGSYTIIEGKSANARSLASGN